MGNQPHPSTTTEFPFTTAKMSSRPTVGILGADGASSGETHPLPAVFSSPIRPDIVQSVHTGMAKNKRQPYAVSEKAGHQTSAESWGTGRAVARIPRVSGGGTHRAGQAAFGNQCRSGRMFAPTKVWRKWHQKINLGQKRFATASAIAASSSAALLMARGHRVSTVPEVPLVIYEPEKDGKEIVTATRNIPGVETCPVYALNLLQLAPGGHLGRFIVWTSSAFNALDSIYGSTTQPAELKKDYVLPQNTVSQPDIAKLINSSEVQSVLRPVRGGNVTKRASVQKKNPLRNKQVLLRLNPYAAAYSKAGLGPQSVDEGKPKHKDELFYQTLHEN